MANDLQQGKPYHVGSCGGGKAGDAAGKEDCVRLAGRLSYKRMNETVQTRARLMKAAQGLFARHGYQGTSIRAITAAANLGAVTYHFGSKENLCLEAFASSVRPLVEKVATLLRAEGSPLERIEAILRAIFAHLEERKEAAALFVQELATERPIPPPMRIALETNVHVLSRLIREGHRDGSVIDGDAVLLALSMLAQPLYLTVAQRPLRDVIGLDRDEPETQRAVVEHVVAFVMRALAAPAGRRPRRSAGRRSQ